MGSQTVPCELSIRLKIFNGVEYFSCGWRLHVSCSLFFILFLIGSLCRKPV